MLKLQSTLKATACLAAVVLAAMGCSQDEWTGQSVQKGNTTIIASFEGANTRTSVDEQSKVVWNENDAFGLFYTKEQNLEVKVEEFTCPDADGTSTDATFKGALDTEITTSYAVYPYQIDMGLNGNTVSMTLPATFKYTKASNGPMYADAKDINSKLHFKHLAGLLKLTVSEGIQIEAQKFVITADKDIAGTCTADLSATAGDGPVLAVTSNGSKTITVTLTDEAKNTNTVFYIPIPVGTYATLSARLLGENDTPISAEKVWTNIEVKRREMRTAAFGFVTINAVTDDINEAIKNAVPTGVQATETTTPLQIEGKIDVTNITEIKVPVYEKSNVNLSLAEIPVTTTEKPLTLSDATNTEVTVPAETSLNAVTVAIPETIQGEDAPVLDINMPSTTVVLDATGTKATYKKVTATTASNTLVIEKDVIVEELVVKGGNVRVKGTVQKISKDATLDSKPYLIVEDGATIPTEPTDFEVRNFLAYDIEMAMNKGEEYRLTSDISIIGKNIIVPEGKALTLDLNGYTITAANMGGDNILVLGNLTLKDSTGDTGKIVASEDYAKGLYSSTLISIEGENASMTMESGNIYAVRQISVDNGQFGVGIFNGGDFTMTGGKIEAGWFAVAGNGTNTGTSQINIKGGELISTSDYALYLPHAGTTTITGGIVRGKGGGISMQRGTVEISGEALVTCEGGGDTGEWSDGTSGQGNYAVNVFAKYGDCTLTIKGGTFIAAAEAISTIGEGDLHVKNITISGGTFSDPSALAYLTADAKVKVILNKDIVITEPIVVGPSKSVLLDLKGHSITPQAGGLTTVLNTNDAMVLVRRGANLTIYDGGNGIGKIDASNATSVLCGIKLTDAADEKEGEVNLPTANLLVSGGIIIGNYYGISGNGTRHGTVIKIIGGTIRAANKTGGTGIFHPQDGTLTVDGGTIEAYNSGIEIRSGVLNIEAGTINTTATDFKAASNGNGTTVVGAAVAVSQHVTNKKLEVTVKGGTLNGNGYYALYEEDLEDENITDISMTVTGGTLNGKVFSENCTGFIKGGTFTNFNPAYPIEDTESAYVAQGFTVICDGQEATKPHSGVVDKTYEVKQQQ